MSPASYLTAPPRGVPQMLAASDLLGALHLGEIAR